MARKSARRAADPWRGRAILITAGPTREHLDPIRFLTNASSGRMGYALARAALKRAARVIVVHGPTGEPPPPGARCVSVTNASEMHRAVLDSARRVDAVIGTAAVGDWRFSRTASRKIRRGSRPLKVTLVPNADILADLEKRRRGGRLKTGTVLVGFALETDDWLARAKEKMRRKGLDLVVANRAETLGSERIRFALVSGDAHPVILPAMTKERAAEIILDRVGALLEKSER
jgi:phosphopantothenoylcysteine decarboxylase/phosphopantothenate--cysteine ligase